MTEEISQESIVSGEMDHKHLALTKVIKTNLNKNIDDESVEYSPAYINSFCSKNNGAEHRVQFQITSIYNFFLHNMYNIFEIYRNIFDIYKYIFSRILLIQKTT